jgi:hypothetical protein
MVSPKSLFLTGSSGTASASSALFHLCELYSFYPVSGAFVDFIIKNPKDMINTEVIYLEFHVKCQSICTEPKNSSCIL